MLRPDVELRLVVMVAGFFLVVLLALAMSTVLWPMEPEGSEVGRSTLGLHHNPRR